MSNPINGDDRPVKANEASANDAVGEAGSGSPLGEPLPDPTTSTQPLVTPEKEAAADEPGTDEPGTDEPGGGVSPDSAAAESELVVQPELDEDDLQSEDVQSEDVQGEDVQDEDVQDEDVQDEDVQDEEDEADEDDVQDVAPLEEITEEEDDGSDKSWFILKVQSNREKSICEGLQRRVKIEGLEKFFGEIIVPTEDVAEFKNGKRRIVKRKLYPGYIVVNMVLNDDTWFIVRETPGIGDFTGSVGKPTPMLPEEVERIVRAAHPEQEDSESVKTAIPFQVGDRVRIKEGTFENFEGDVDVVDEANGRVTVMINIFGRSTPVELEHWQIESV